MNFRHVVLLNSEGILLGLSLFITILFGCSPPVPEGSFDAKPWSAKYDTLAGGEYRVTTLGGSIWQGGARLQELWRIGSGPQEAYVLGNVLDVAMDANGGRILVLDDFVPAIRVYDLAGKYMQDIGRAGDGPGEYRRPCGITVDAESGRIVVRDYSLKRLTVYSNTGSYVGSSSVPWDGSTKLLPASSGRVYFEHVFVESASIRVDSFIELDPVSGIADTIRMPVVRGEKQYLVGADRPIGRSVPLPFGPEPVWTIAQTGEVVSGFSSSYRLTRLRNPQPIVEVSIQAPVVPVVKEERAWWKRRTELSLAGRSANRFAIPKSKPAFSSLFVDELSRVWIVREGPGVRMQPCAAPDGSLSEYRKSPCWYSSLLLDVVDYEGRYLGSLTLPSEFVYITLVYADASRLLVKVYDRSGTTFVILFALKTP